MATTTKGSEASSVIDKNYADSSTSAIDGPVDRT